MQGGGSSCRPPAEGETPVAWANLTSSALPKLCVAFCGSEPGHLACHPPPRVPVSPQVVLLEHLADEETSPGDAVKEQMEIRGAENGSWACVLPRRPCEGSVPAHTP